MLWFLREILMPAAIGFVVAVLVSSAMYRRRR